MRTIYKYPLEVTGVQELELPHGAEILDIQMQHGAPQAWVLLDPDITTGNFPKIAIYGTGHGIPDDVELKYISTFQVNEGQFIFHAFEVL